MNAKQFQEIAERLGWNVTIDGHHIDLQRYSPEGQDCNFSIRSDGNLVEEAYRLYENYDPSEETMMWVDESGHGKNGAPYHLKDILADMEAVEEMLRTLYLEISNG